VRLDDVHVRAREHPRLAIRVEGVAGKNDDRRFLVVLAYLLAQPNPGHAGQLAVDDVKAELFLLYQPERRRRILHGDRLQVGIVQQVRKKVARVFVVINTEDAHGVSLSSSCVRPNAGERAGGSVHYVREGT
jgi:hypothetical protein